jgi:hypothetical protein
VDSHFLV